MFSDFVHAVELHRGNRFDHLVLEEFRTLLEVSEVSRACDTCQYL